MQRVRVSEELAALAGGESIMRKLLKACVSGVFLVVAFVPAVLSGFGRLKPVYTFFAHACATVPGGIGDYLRGAYYHMTLQAFDLSSRISFGSFFAHPEAQIGKGVYIGSYCIVGRATIGDGTLLASSVQVLSGQHQHTREDEGTAFSGGQFVHVSIGADSWIGAAAIVMADVGSRTTVGAGSVVTRPVPDDCVAAGSPARVIRGGEGTSAETGIESSRS
jgi:acetyltransferase-like isoleucine patch superfamily enzyme